MTQPTVLWERHEAVEFLTELEKAIAPAYHVALGGSVLTKGQSFHDLDVIIYPHTKGIWDYEILSGLLRDAGMKQTHNREFLTNIWRRKGSLDEKHVEAWDIGGKRVDLFFLS